MEFGFWQILNLIGALGFFIYGMKVMSEGIQKAAGSRLRQILGSMTRNRFLGVGTGFLITSLIQSSSATTVMVVSFANAGLLTLTESIGVIMGANIGTTLTAWLISIFGFKVKISAFAMPIIAIGFPMMFSKRNTLKSLGEVFIGFALLFLGLNELKEAVPDLKGNPQVLEFLANYTNYGIFSTMLFVFIGTVLTVVVQSSSAAMALTLTLLFNGVIPFEVAAGMVMGENIGTTITANIAALVGNVHAKRAALAHFIFNVFGVVWMIILFPFFIDFVQAMWEPFGAMLQSFIPGLDKGQQELQLSLFHTTFNIINVALLIGFVPLIAKTVMRLIPSRSEEDEEFKLRYINTGVMSTAEIGVGEARKEVQEFGKLIGKMGGNVMSLLFEKNKNPDKLIAKIKKREDITDRLEVEIADFLTKVAAQDISEHGSKRVRGMLSMINDMERIGDIYYQMVILLERVQDKKVKFPEDGKKELQDLLNLVINAEKQMNLNVNGDFNAIDIDLAYELEDYINAKRDELISNHYHRLEEKRYSVTDGILFLEYINLMEKVGDHIVNINEAIAGIK